MYNTFKNIYTEYLKHIIFGGKGALFLKKKKFSFPYQSNRTGQSKNLVALILYTF